MFDGFKNSFEREQNMSIMELFLKIFSQNISYSPNFFFRLIFLFRLTLMPKATDQSNGEKRGKIFLVKTFDVDKCREMFHATDWFDNARLSLARIGRRDASLRFRVFFNRSLMFGSSNANQNCVHLDSRFALPACDDWLKMDLTLF